MLKFNYIEKSIKFPSCCLYLGIIAMRPKKVVKHFLLNIMIGTRGNKLQEKKFPPRHILKNHGTLVRETDSKPSTDGERRFDFTRHL